MQFVFVRLTPSAGSAVVKDIAMAENTLKTKLVAFGLIKFIPLGWTFSWLSHPAQQQQSLWHIHPVAQRFDRNAPSGSQKIYIHFHACQATTTTTTTVRIIIDNVLLFGLRGGTHLKCKKHFNDADATMPPVMVDVMAFFFPSPYSLCPLLRFASAPSARPRKKK